MGLVVLLFQTLNILWVKRGKTTKEISVLATLNTLFWKDRTQWDIPAKFGTCITFFNHSASIHDSLFSFTLSWTRPDSVHSNMEASLAENGVEGLRRQNLGTATTTNQR